MMFILVAFVLVGLLSCCGFIYSELSAEVRFRSIYGANWRTEYEQARGSLAQAHVKIAASATGIVGMITLTAWLGRLLRPHGHSKHSSQKRQRAHHHLSPLERAVAYRRNALVGIYFGLAGIALGVFLVIFRTALFADHSNQMVFGIFVFLAGYSGVIAGCSYWLKAKAWNEAVVFIGLMPLAILLIPFVRLILLAAPAILPCGMVMMPLVLVVVVSVLPDKSGISRRKPSWERARAAWAGPERAKMDSEASRSSSSEASERRSIYSEKSGSSATGAPPQ